MILSDLTGVNANARFGNIPTIAGETTAEEFNKVFPNG